MSKITAPHDYSERDARIAVNSYTTVLRRPGVPHEVFATYWRDVHGPLCSRIPGLGFYVQHHFHRERDAHLWPSMEGIAPFDDYVLDGGVEIGFETEADQKTFDRACSILFADEQNVFAATVAYALPSGSRTVVDHLADGSPNEDDGLDRLHVHLGAAAVDDAAFTAFTTAFAEKLASAPSVLKLRLHRPERYDNEAPAPPAPDVSHTVAPERARLAVLELAFESPMRRRELYASELFRSTIAEQQAHVAHATAFAVSGVYTFVRDKQLTTAGLRGSRAAQLIERLGAQNQIAEDVRTLLLTGAP